MLEHPHSKCLTNGSQVLLGVLSPDFPILGTRGCEPPRPVWGRAGPQQRSHQPLMTQALRNPHAEALLPTESLPRRAQLCVSWEPRRAGRLSSSVVSWTAASKPELSSPGTQLRLKTAEPQYPGMSGRSGKTQPWDKQPSPTFYSLTDSPPPGSLPTPASPTRVVPTGPGCG